VTAPLYNFQFKYYENSNSDVIVFVQVRFGKHELKNN
jgi:hypothetical protein